MHGRGSYHTTTQKLKNWINNDIKNQLDLERVDNTADLDKPLSNPQRDFIRDNTNSIKTEFNTITTDLLQNKASLVNGIVPLTQLPLDLKMKGTTDVSMSAFTQNVKSEIATNNAYVLSQINFSAQQHLALPDPHGTIPRITQAVDSLRSSVDTKLDTKASTSYVDNRVPSNLLFDIISDHSLKISVVGKDGITRSTILGLS